uniref:Small ribosomal subunit protein uS9c n=1 Tax=Sundstroemia setigera TaxID=3005 RepID=A0A2U9NMY2_9STRA|nr:ribosomal protein S9 [Rhizosolenia setigera]AWT38461.1 ribosomal protein S9 [Rhizosolenia setigera]
MATKIESIFQKDKIGIGRRKQAVARVFLTPGTGQLVINKVAGEKYLQYNTSYLNDVWAPLRVLNLETQYDVTVLVRGGGLTGQADSIKLGLSNLLCKIDENNRSILKPYGLLTRDARIKERKKYGLRKARKAPQYSKR